MGLGLVVLFLYIPKKILPSVLQNIHSLLKADGYFYLTVKKGVGEGLKADLRYGNFEKFWSFFEEDEIAEQIRSVNFQIVDCCTVQKKFKYQNRSLCAILFCQKK